MRGSNGRSRRHRRLASATFTVTGLVLSIFLMFGQLGLIVASADDRGRDGTFESDTDVITTDDGSGSGGAGAAASSGAPQIQSRDDAAVRTGRNQSKIPIDNNQVGALEGLIAGGDPSDNGDWTPGNLCQGNGPCYHELDNVPHRILLNGLTAGTEYSFTILIDAQDNAGHRGYDDLGNVVGLSGVAGAVAVVQNPDTTTGCGASTTCESYTFTFTASGTDAEIRFTAHLAIGSHLYGGSSLSVRLLGSARNVPLPVGDILLDIRAHKFNDLNGNGTQDAGEPDLAGWTMTLFSGPTCAGQPVNVTGNAGTDTNPGVTDGTGDVDWTNLSASDGDNDGRFSVLETLQAGWTNTTPLCREVTVVGLENLATFGNQQQQPTLTITKTANVTNNQVAPNTQFTYTITVANTGNAQATGVVITDTLPASLVSPSATFSVDGGASQACTFPAGVMTCTVGNLAAGKSVIVTVTATSPSTCRQISNSATVDSDQTSPQTSTASIITVVGCGVAISKTASPTPNVTAGGTVTFTIMAENQEAGSVTGVVIADTLPAGFTILTTPADKPVFDIDPGDAPAAADCGVVGQTVTCNVGTLAGSDGTTGDGQDFVVVTIKATAPSVCGPFSNTATVDWDQNPSQYPVSSNSATGNVTGCVPSLQLSKTGASTVATGANITWTITVSNAAGNADATNVVVTDTLPAGFTFVSASAGCVNDTPSAGQVQCTIGTIAAGQSASVTITATAPTTCGPFTNTVSGTFGTGSTIPGSPATASGDVTGCAPGLTINKSGPATVQQGTSITYTVTVSNSGNATAFNVQISDVVPSPLTNPVGTPSQGSCTTTTNTVNCSLGTIQGGGSVTISITASVPAGQCVQIQNQATGTHEVNEQNVAIQSSNTVTTQITGCAPPPPPGSPVLSVIKTADAAVVQSGSPIGFTITVSNSGSAAANNVTLSDTIPAVPGVTWSINGGTGAAQCSLTGNSLSCSFGTLSPGASKSVHIVSTATSTNSCGTFTNVAVANSSNAGSATGQATVTVECPAGTPDIRIVKEAHPDSGSPGEVITYVYRITNTGDVTLFDISVDDDIVGHICDIPELDPGESVKCTADYTIPEDANISITNVVVAVGEDENGTEVSDEDEVTILVILGTTVTPTPTVTPPGGVAFTGTGVFVPLAGLALLMLTLGTGLLWWGRRRGSHESDVFNA
jgi:uncharacterized repeat protein (TIGR01451 family)/fimbrial isopeptide formation D2 family protein